MRVQRGRVRAAMPPTYRIIEDEPQLEALVETLLGEPAYAIDTEFARERTYFADLALVQIAWGTSVAIVDPLRVDVRPLARVFASPALAVLHAASADLEIFAQRMGGVPTRMFDTQIAGAFLGYGLTSLGQLLRGVLGVEVSKSEQLNDWKRRPLTTSALDYAANDVAYLLELQRSMETTLSAKGRLSWVEEECERGRTREHGMRDPETAWWKLKGKANLSLQAEGVAQCVAALREREAARRDLVARFVLADLAVLAIAHRAPKTPAELAAVRGVDVRQLSPEFTKALLNAVARGVALPADARRAAVRPDTEAPAAIAGLCMAWLTARAAEERIDPAMLATRDEIAAFILDPSRGRLASGFRHELVGRDLIRLLEGQATISVEGGARLVLRDV